MVFFQKERRPYELILILKEWIYRGRTKAVIKRLTLLVISYELNFNRYTCLIQGRWATGSKIMDEFSDCCRNIAVLSPHCLIFLFSFQALVGQLVTLPRLIKDDKKYTVTVDTISSERFPPPKRATSHFRSDEYYKYIEIAISKQVCLSTVMALLALFSCIYFIVTNVK
jgi:hypothetical protein